MPRQVRIHRPGGFCHVVLRGHDGQFLFFVRSDRREFTRLLDQGRARIGCRIHGFCLMSDHAHLLLEAGELPLSRLIHALTSRYARWVNRRAGRRGPIFQGRHKELLFDADRYLAELLRYIHLSPLRAGLATAPERYEWSSHRAYLGEQELPWLTTERALGLLDRRADKARTRYRAFVEAGRGQGERPDLQAGVHDRRVLGDRDFVARVLAAPAPHTAGPDLTAIIAGVLGDYGLSEADLAAATRRRDCTLARGVIGRLATRSGAATLAGLAARLGRDPATWSRAVRKVEQTGLADAEFRRRLARIEAAVARA